ncbi:MAG: type II toxin-antitoxin system VapC family toxin [Polyangiaceae bacterium]
MPHLHDRGDTRWRAAMAARLRALPATTGLATSRLSRLECRSKPIRDRDAALLARYDATFTSARIVEVTPAIIERATELRAHYGFRSPDAIHLATAIDGGADVFLTGDAALARCTEIAVNVVAPGP